jgi:hypothetical protein
MCILVKINGKYEIVNTDYTIKKAQCVSVALHIPADIAGLLFGTQNDINITPHIMLYYNDDYDLMMCNVICRATMYALERKGYKELGVHYDKNLWLIAVFDDIKRWRVMVDLLRRLPCAIDVDDKHGNSIGLKDNMIYKSEEYDDNFAITRGIVRYIVSEKQTIYASPLVYHDNTHKLLCLLYPDCIENLILFEHREITMEVEIFKKNLYLYHSDVQITFKS